MSVVFLQCYKIDDSFLKQISSFFSKTAIRLPILKDIFMKWVEISIMKQLDFQIY